jgi:hypothetical protein
MLYMNDGNSKQIIVSDRVFNTKSKPTRNNKRNQSRKSLKELQARIGDDADEFRNSLMYFQSMNNIALSKEPFPDDDIKVDNDKNIKVCINDSSGITSNKNIETSAIDIPHVPAMDNINTSKNGIKLQTHHPLNNCSMEIVDKDIDPVSDKPGIQFKVACDPPYGILQRGKKPTFRTWKRTRSIRHKQPTNIEISQSLPPKRDCNPNKRNRTIKHLIGRRNNVISVLLKNVDLIDKVNTEINAIRKHKMCDIRRTLKKCNIIKNGSTAPVGILREIYENSTLAGKIKNKSPEILLHNFVNSK